MKKKRTVWDIFKNFINSQELGNVVTRKQIIEHLSKCGMEDYDCAYKISSSDNKEFYSKQTLDYIRNLSEKVGFLDKADCVGEFYVNKHFPSGYTVSQLRKDYNKLW